MKDFKHLLIHLRKHENAALITANGELKQGFAHRENDLTDNADALQALMIDIMKSPDAQSGVWLWKISEKWNCISGWEIIKEEEAK